MRYPRAWLSMSTPSHEPGRPAGQKPAARGTTAPAGPAAVNAKAERCRVARQDGADASAQGYVWPLARGRPVTPGPPRRNPWHAPLARHLSHSGRRKRRRLRADPGARTKAGAHLACLLGCLTSERCRCARDRRWGNGPAAASKPLARYGAFWWRARSRLAWRGGRPSD